MNKLIDHCFTFANNSQVDPCSLLQPLAFTSVWSRPQQIPGENTVAEQLLCTETL